MSAGDDSGTGFPNEPARRDGCPRSPRGPLPPDVPSKREPWPPENRRPFPPPQRPYAGRPERSAWRTLAIIVVTVLSLCGLMSIAITVLFVVSLNNWASNK